jgi:hypothetical protein
MDCPKCGAEDLWRDAVKYVPACKLIKELEGMKYTEVLNPEVESEYREEGYNAAVDAVIERLNETTKPR